jgi:hypothetical protein
MDEKRGGVMAETCEPCDADHVAFFATDSRAHHGDGLALARVVAELVENFRDDDRLRCSSVEDEPERSR